MPGKSTKWPNLMDLSMLVPLLQLQLTVFRESSYPHRILLLIEEISRSIFCFYLAFL